MSVRDTPKSPVILSVASNWATNHGISHGAAHVLVNCRQQALPYQTGTSPPALPSPTRLNSANLVASNKLQLSPNQANDLVGLQQQFLHPSLDATADSSPFVQQFFDPSAASQDDATRAVEQRALREHLMGALTPSTLASSSGMSAWTSRKAARGSFSGTSQLLVLTLT
jgi:hypothetical protein